MAENGGDLRRRCNATSMALLAGNGAATPMLQWSIAGARCCDEASSEPSVLQWSIVWGGGGGCCYEASSSPPVFQWTITVPRGCFNGASLGREGCCDWTACQDLGEEHAGVVAEETGEQIEACGRNACVFLMRCQSRAAAEVASEIAAAFTGASVGEEEEVVCSGALVAKAVECGLRCLTLERGWSFVGESIYAQSTFAASEERTDLCVLNVEVRSGLNDDYEFVVSPDAFRFTTLKISDVASSNVMETFQHIKEVSLDGYNLQTACAILPTLQEGHVIGFSELPPSGQILDSFTKLCSVKVVYLAFPTIIFDLHGLEMNYSYHAAVKLTCGASCEKQWLPSPFVLQGPGLQPAPKSVRASKAMSSMRSFIELLKAWNFFGQSQLVIKEQLVVNCTATLPTWDKATSKLAMHTARAENSEDLRLVHPGFMAKDQSLTLEVNEQIKTKQAVLLTSVNPKRKHAEILENSGEGGTVKDCAPNVPQDTASVLHIQKDVFRTKVKPTKSKSMVGKNEITAATTSKRKPEVVKDELTKKAIDHQKDVTNKVTKAKPGSVKDESTSITKTKTKPDVDKDELTAKVIDHHKRGQCNNLWELHATHSRPHQPRKLVWPYILAGATTDHG
ncbi:hypothetical protein TRIUR3_33051 [Triticum urartu]|uniref:Uncharacterized protein n=1 Tax=Triticum urartu TaxID=4572 RepID=M7ZJ46_TRIUA|nr:hypothetical protein TRIUR3_33051 [Triticum urartu]